MCTSSPLHTGRGPRRVACRASEWGDRGLDEVWSRLRERTPELRGEFWRRAGPAGGDAHASGEGGEVEVGPGQVEQATSGLPGGHRADSVKFHVEDRVAPVAEDDRGDIQLFPRMGPQGRDRVHGAAVRFEGEDGTVRAGDGGADRKWQPLAYRAPGQG